MEREITLISGHRLTVKGSNAFIFQAAARALKKEGLAVLGPGRDDLDTTIEFGAEVVLQLITSFKDAAGTNILIGDRKTQREIINSFDGIRDIVTETAREITKEEQKELTVAKGK